MKYGWKDIGKRGWGLTLSACLVVAFYVAITHLGMISTGLKRVLHFCQPVIIGIVIAYVLNPLANFLRRTVFGRVRVRKAAWILSVVVTIILVLILLSLLLGMLIPQLISSTMRFVENINSYVASLQRFVRSLGLPSQALEDKLEELVSSENGLLSQLTTAVTKNFSKVLHVSSSIGSQAMNWVISFILAIYLLLDKHRIVGFIDRFFFLLLSDRAYGRFSELWKQFNVILSRFVVCDIVDAIVVACANYIFMLITGMPYALLVSAVVGVANLAPTFGPIVGAVIGGFILLLSNPLLVLWFVIFTIILQTVDGYILKPKMFGDVLNVPSILILASIIIGGRMFGVTGLLLAIPVAALLKYIYHVILVPKLELRHAARSAAMPAAEAPEKAPAGTAEAP